MIKRTLILAALVCAMAGEMYASNTETQVVNPQPESVRILQEQLCISPLQLSMEQNIPRDWHFTIESFGNTYNVDIHLEVSSERIDFEITITKAETETNEEQSVHISGSSTNTYPLSESDITYSVSGSISGLEIDASLIANLLNEAFSNNE